MTVKEAARLMRDTYNHWNQSNASFLAAGLSYFTIFSLAPLMILAIAIVGFIYGPAASEGAVADKIGGFIGREVAESIQKLIINARKSGMGTATVFSIALLLAGASNVFKELQIALNMIWRVEAGSLVRGFKSRVRYFLKKRFLSYAMVLMIGLLLALLFFVDAGLGILRHLLGNILPFLAKIPLWKAANLGASFLLLALLTAVIYRYLPDTDIAWGDVWIGSLATSLFLAIGKLLIELYFNFSHVTSIYGVASSLIVILVGIYLAAQVFLLGAEFTWVYATQYGSRARRRKEDAEALEGAPE